MKRLIVTGSRYGWAEPEFRRCMKTATDILDSADITIVQGGAPGVDNMAAQYAMDHDLCVETVPADWARLGKRAGPIRNQEMVDRGADFCIAFITKDSKGTKDCAKRAKKAGITTLEVFDV